MLRSEAALVATCTPASGLHSSSSTTSSYWYLDFASAFRSRTARSAELRPPSPMAELPPVRGPTKAILTVSLAWAAPHRSIAAVAILEMIMRGTVPNRRRDWYAHRDGHGPGGPGSLRNDRRGEGRSRPSPARISHLAAPLAARGPEAFAALSRARSGLEGLRGIVRRGACGSRFAGRIDAAVPRRARSAPRRRRRPRRRFGGRTDPRRAGARPRSRAGGRGRRPRRRVGDGISRDHPLLGPGKGGEPRQGARPDDAREGPRAPRDPRRVRRRGGRPQAHPRRASVRSPPDGVDRRSAREPPHAPSRRLGRARRVPAA